MSRNWTGHALPGVAPDRARLAAGHHEYVKIPGEHVTTAGTGVPGALAHLNARLAGLPAPSGC